jgi:membrane protein implicated in regulation of membrane protease activity
VLLELPGWIVAGVVLGAAVTWWDLAPRIAALLLALWVGKDFVLYPLLRVAYEDSSRNGTDYLIGALGTVREPLDPEGWVRVGSELWRAELAAETGPAEPGSAVRVVEVRGMTLRVEPV